MIIYTDVPLDEYLDGLPPLKNDPLGDDVKILPLGYRPRLKYGPLEFVDWTFIMKRPLRDSEPLEGNWWAYIPPSDEMIPYEEIISPYFNSKCIFSVNDLIFIYWYLANVGNTIVVEFGECMGLIPEVPISKIDISDKKIGRMPINDYRRRGIRYVFTDSKKTANKYDTGILKSMESHEKTESPYWRSISGSVTLMELIKLCGNIISKVILFEQGDVSVKGAAIPDTVPPKGKIPSPKAVFSIQYPDQEDNAGYRLDDKDEAILKKYADCKVCSYMLYSRDSMSRFAYHDVEDEIGLVAVMKDVYS